MIVFCGLQTRKTVCPQKMCDAIYKTTFLNTVNAYIPYILSYIKQLTLR